METESTAFLGTLWAQCAQSAPRKAVDLINLNLFWGVFWNYRHAGTWTKGLFFYKEYESGIVKMIQSNSSLVAISTERVNRWHFQHPGVLERVNDMIPLIIDESCSDFPVDSPCYWHLSYLFRLSDQVWEIYHTSICYAWLLWNQRQDTKTRETCFDPCKALA